MWPQSGSLANMSSGQPNLILYGPVPLHGYLKHDQYTASGSFKGLGRVKTWKLSDLDPIMMWDSGAPGYHSNCRFLDSHWDSPATEEALTEIAIICEKLLWTIAVSGQKKGQSGRQPVTVRDVLLQLQENLQQVANIHEHEALQKIRSGYYDSVYRRIDF